MSLFRVPAIVGISCLSLALAGCESTQNSLESVFAEEKPVRLLCPDVRVIKNLTRFVSYRDGQQDLSNVLIDAKIDGLASSCIYDRSGPLVEVEATVTMEVGRGPANDNRIAELDYFVAVVDGRDRILTKKVFPTRFEFPQGQLSVQAVEQASLTIPLSALEQGPEYRILIGYQLSPEQRDDNLRQTGS